MLKKVPEEIDYEQTAKIMSDDPSPLNVVLLQEVTTSLRFSKWNSAQFCPIRGR